VARAFALLADPGAARASDRRTSLAPALTRIRRGDARKPEMVAGTRDRLDTLL